MTKPSFRNWQGVQEEVRRRIHAREWKPGDLIPTEADLATEFGCARSTVNRALQSLAETGLLDRKRKAGTRVAAQPVAKATFEISLIRLEIEAKGQRYDYHLIDRRETSAPPPVRAAFGADKDSRHLHVQALHMADRRPYVIEDRWINLDVAPQARHESFENISCNEWLLKTAPYTHGQITFSACSASDQEAALLECAPGSALMIVDRLTLDEDRTITKVRLSYQSGHHWHSAL